MPNYRFLLVLSVAVACSSLSPGQELTVRRGINVSFSAINAAQLSVNRGRLVWRETDPLSSNYDLKYFSGVETFLLDSNLVGVSAAIDGDHVVWNTSSELVKLFNTRSWDTSWLGSSYNPDGLQPVAVANGVVGYARRRSGTGTQIVVHRIAGSADTVFDEGAWNTEPSLHHGQLAWVVSASESLAAASDIMFYNGVISKNLSFNTNERNRHPLLRDGQVLWLEMTPAAAFVKLFTGDSVVVIAQPSASSEIITGYDLSDGIAVAGLCDTLTNQSRIITYDTETMLGAVTNDSDRISAPHIDNGIVVWQSGTGPGKVVKMMPVAPGTVSTLAAGENPVIDDDVLAWTLGDAVELNVPLTYEQMTTDLQNGWEQSRFKPIDNGNLMWQDFTNSVHGRLYYSDGTSVTQLTDSSSNRDFIMLNDGHAIWREEADTLWLYDGSGPAKKLIDTIQVENMVISGDFIGFNGFGLHVGNNINQAWIYDIVNGLLRQLTYDDTSTSNNAFLQCDGNAAIWARDSSEHRMIMWYDGNAVRRLSVSDTLGFMYSYRNGIIVWSENVSGVEQIMMYDVGAGVKTQLTAGTGPSTKPLTDGFRVVWHSDLLTNPTIYYHDIATAATARVAHAALPTFRWPWMSNGKIVFAINGDIFTYDGIAVSQMTASGLFPPKKEPYIDREIVVWNATDPSNPSTEPRGNIFKGKLHAHPGFDVDRPYGLAPLTVSFFNNSWQGSQTYHWDFGDGSSGVDANPTHTYVAPGTYSVTLTTVGPTGAFSEKKIKLVRTVSSTAVDGKGTSSPSSFALFQNYPNPFNPTTRIRYYLPTRSHVAIRVYNTYGQEIETVLSAIQDAGERSVGWNAGDRPSGVYYVEMTAGTFFDVKKMVVVK